MLFFVQALIPLPYDLPPRIPKPHVSKVSMLPRHFIIAVIRKVLPARARNRPGNRNGFGTRLLLLPVVIIRLGAW